MNVKKNQYENRYHITRKKTKRQYNEKIMIYIDDITHNVQHMKRSCI